MTDEANTTPPISTDPEIIADLTKIAEASAELGQPLEGEAVQVSHFVLYYGQVHQKGYDPTPVFAIRLNGNDIWTIADGWIYEGPWQADASAAIGILSATLQSEVQIRREAAIAAEAETTAAAAEAKEQVRQELLAYYAATIGTTVE